MLVPKIPRVLLSGRRFGRHFAEMATTNPFYLLGDNDNDDPSQFIVDQRQKLDAKKPAAKASTAPAAAKLPTKPVPPAQAC